MRSYYDIVPNGASKGLRLRSCLVQKPVQEREKLGVQSRNFAVRNQNSKVGILKITLDWDGWENAAQPGGILVSLTTIASSSVGLGEDCHYQVVLNQTIETFEPVFFDCNVFTLLHLNSNGLPATQRSYNGECRIKIMNGNYYGIENIYQFERIPQLH